jgi:hypothetical protein
MHTKPTTRREARPLRKWFSTVAPQVSWPSRRPENNHARALALRSVVRMSGARFERDSALRQEKVPFRFPVDVVSFANPAPIE